MMLTIGQRLEGRWPSAYVVGQRLMQTPWYELCAARKVFFNYRYRERSFYEAAEDECLDVLVRVGVPARGGAGAPSPASTDSSAAPGGAGAESEQREMHELRQLLWYEMTHVLGTGAWFPEPIDWLELSLPVRPVEPPESASQIPILVMSQPHGTSLRDWRRTRVAGSDSTVRVAAEILDMLKSLHDAGQVVGAFSPDDFRIDEAGRLYFLATDRVIPAAQSLRLRHYFPPSRYPHSFAALELTQPNQSLDSRSDLYSWAALCFFLATGSDPAPAMTDACTAGSPSAAVPQLEFESWLGGAIRRAPNVIRLLDNRSVPSSLERIEHWSHSISSCLTSSRAHRPRSVDLLRSGPVPPRIC
jgi:hypothetical protein